MRQVLRFNKIVKAIVISGDLVILNVIFILSYSVLGMKWLDSEFANSLPQILVLLNLCYLICNIQSGVVLHLRVIRPEQIVLKAIQRLVIFGVLYISVLTFCNFDHLSARFFVLFYSCFGTCLIFYRLFFRHLVKKHRKGGGNTRNIILVGSNSNMIELFHEMAKNPTYGYRIIGYFEDAPTHNFPEALPYLGQPKDVIGFLNKHNTTQVFCSLSSSRSEEIIPIVNYCENHLVRFFSVPNVRNYLKRRMWFEVLGSVPVLCIRQEPLSHLENRILKRGFDVFCSFLFLLTLFPIIYVCVGIAIKICSPGPVLFKQKRSGEDGREFWCYKFRSMKINAQSDILQATENDPRKTKIGEFIRKTSIDELPQFINVLKGDMSIVGPRPHMLKHTAEYSRLINKFMVRHFIKPGITGWAQVTGFRGETKELWQMEGRVQRDIWYIEHWTFMLDLLILHKTICNAIRGDREAY